MTSANSFDRSNPVGSGERLLPRRELRTLVPVSDMTIWRWERGGHFPRHLSVNGRNYWLLSELRVWMAAQQRGGGSARTDLGP